MFFRKIEQTIENHLSADSDKILIIEGARQVGKSFIVRETGRRLFRNFVEINFVEDDEGSQLFKNIHTTKDFYFALSSVNGGSLNSWDDTLVFLDEIQHYPQYLTLLKFFRQEHRFRFIASGSLLGLALRSTTSIPVGSILIKEMYPMDFEEFLWANDMGREAIAVWKEKFETGESLPEATHKQILSLFKHYLLVGGMPDAVKEFITTRNIARVREVHENIRRLYKMDAAKYESDFGRKLQIQRIYEMVPSQMENKKKRMVAKDIQNEKGDRFSRYLNEFEYLISSGICLDVHAVSNPRFPLSESVQKNLLKLYMNDVGMLTALLYRNNLQQVWNDERSINLGAIYETVVAQELKAHGHDLFYFDNRSKGEVDFLVNDYNRAGVLPIEVKSGRDYQIHSALNNLLKIPDYHISTAVVLSNNREINRKDSVVYLPIYDVMFL